MNVPSFVCCLASLSLALSAAAAERTALQARAESTLAAALASETGWVRIHAAEAWAALGARERVRPLFAAELPAYEKSPYRTGAWRVLATVSPDERAACVRKLEAVFLDTTAADRLQAIESLAKLRHVLSGSARAAARRMTATASPADATFAWWALAHAQDADALPALARALAHEDLGTRRRGAYIVRRLPALTPALREALATALAAAPADAPERPYLLAAALHWEGDATRATAWRAELERLLPAASAGVRYEICQALMLRTTPADLSPLVPLLDAAEGDARIGAAWAVLHVLGAK